MTQIPDWSGPSETADPPPEGEAPAPSFEAILPEPASKVSPRKLFILMGISVVALVGGVIYSVVKPEAPKAKKPVLDVAGMTAHALAENASPAAARELVRRMYQGTPSERASASSVMNCRYSGRLTRNLAMAMAVEQRKQQQEMVRRMEVNRRMVMGGPYRGTRDGRPVYSARPPPDEE